MVQAKVSRELANLGADLTSTDMSTGYVTWSKLKNNSATHGAEENNLLPSQTIASGDNGETLAGAATKFSSLSPPTNNSTSVNLSQSSAKMKFYYHHRQNCFLDCFNDPVPDDTVIYESGIPFQYNKREGRYTEFIGKPTGTIFSHQKGLLSERSNTPNMSSNSNNFRQWNVNENCSTITQIAPAYTSDMSHNTYHAQKWDADERYLCKIKMVLCSHVGGINFADPANIRKTHEELVTQIRTKAIHISNKYKIQ